MSQTPNQTKPSSEGVNSRQDRYEECIKTFGIPSDISSGALSYSERVLTMICHKMSIGDAIDLEFLSSVLDEENMKKMLNLYFKYYDW